METLSCHSNVKHMSKTIKNLIFIEANVMNIPAKFQLHPPYGFWGDDFLYLFTNLAIQLPWQPIKFTGLDKTDMFGRGLLKEHFFVKPLSKYLQWDSNKCQFSLFPLQVMEILSCHSNQSSYSIGTKNTFIPPAYWCYMRNLVNIDITA